MEKFATFEKPVEDLTDKEFGEQTELYESIRHLNDVINEMPLLKKALGDKVRSEIINLTADNIKLFKEYFPALATQTVLVFLASTGVLTPEKIIETLGLDPFKTNFSYDELFATIPIVSVFLNSAILKSLSFAEKKSKDIVGFIVDKYKEHEIGSN